MNNLITPEIFKQIEPFIFQSKFIEAGIRADGRESLMTCRSLIEVVHGVIETSLGSASARIGNTTVIVGITGGIHVSPPGIMTALSDTGRITVSCDYSLPFPGDRRIGQIAGNSLSKKIETVISNSSVINKSQLAIHSEPASPVWDLTVNVVVVRDDGSVMDCALLAVVAALKHVTLPEVDEKLVVVEGGGNSRKLELGGNPMGFTFCLFGESVWIMDPTRDEEMVMPRLTVVVDDNERVLGVFGLEGPQSVGEPCQSFSPSDILGEIWANISKEIANRLRM